MSATTLAMFLTDPASWIAQPGCECQSYGVGLVHEVAKTPIVYAAGRGNSGLTSQEAAILAAALIGLATFLFLLIPILCCLCPIPCTCCGFGKQKAAAAVNKHRNTNISRSDNESLWSTGSWSGNDKTTDYRHNYGVDMKLPRPWVDNSTSGDGIGNVMRQGNGIGKSTQSGIVSFSASDHGGAVKTGAENVALDRSRVVGGDEVTTECTTVRRIDMHVAGMSQNEVERYYNKTFGRNSEMTKDNFMKIYHSYRNNLYGLDEFQ